MAATTEQTLDFSDMYNITRAADGSFSLEPGKPAATTVEVKDKNDTPGSTVTISSAGNGLNGKYDYMGSVQISVGGKDETGYVVYNVVDQQYYLLTTKAINVTKATLGPLDSSGSGSDLACFMPGTRILTPVGERCVEDLKIGDDVITADGRMVPIRWIGCRTVASMFVGELNLPIRIRVGALAPNVPSRDLLVSPDHAIFFDGILIQAGALVNAVSIVREYDAPKVFTYFHIELDNHSLMVAENVPAESFVDNVDRLGFDNWAEHEGLYPEGKPIMEMEYPRAKSARQVPQAIRAKLAERTRALEAAIVLDAAS